MTNSEVTLSVDGRDTVFHLETDAFAAAAREFEVRGEQLEISVKMGGRVYVGPQQMRHWWAMKREGKYYGDIPY
ncbi:hypothetical protein [Hyphomicrobium sp.]|jgi:hypothetical protein|uniref:hypothetical protein n=1 Tax=Hyphomicrobium sp. TaxID=82 RepID=UPI0035614625